MYLYMCVFEREIRSSSASTRQCNGQTTRFMTIVPQQNAWWRYEYVQQLLRNTYTNSFLPLAYGSTLTLPKFHSF